MARIIVETNTTVMIPIEIAILLDDAWLKMIYN
jgi:hypothetical protein